MRRSSGYKAILTTLLAALLLSACGGASTATVVPPTTAIVTPTQAVPIDVPTVPFNVATTLPGVPDIPAAEATVGSSVPAGTPTLSPVSGFVSVQNDQSMVGGPVNGPVSISVQFNAISTSGKLAEMRVNAGGASGCLREIALQSQPWEPYIPEKTYNTTASSGIQGWWVSAQFKDDKGAVSPVYCDDISVEGMPATPAP